MLTELMDAIRTRRARIAVIGLGYVGLPVSCMFADAGFRVSGIDLIEERVAKINAGISPIVGKEPGLDELLARVIEAGRLHAATNYAGCREADVAIIAVETPVDYETKKPGYQALRSALASLGKNLKPGSLIIVESTIAPRTMQDLVQPALAQASGLKANHDFYLAHCPERLMPGRLLHNIATMPRVAGGLTPEATQLTLELYRHIVKGNLDPTDCLTAELVKTTENAYRDVQIAFANEVALICEKVGGDVWKLRQLVNKSPGRNMLLPGAGVGGHCIPKDPWLLVATAKENGIEPTLIPTARAVNDSMPLHMADLAVKGLHEAGKDIRGAVVAILGYSYLENSDDARNSPSEALVKRLQELGAVVRIQDPFLVEYALDLAPVVAGADCVIVMVAHDAYRQMDMTAFAQANKPVIVDGRHIFDAERIRTAGLIYLGIGKGD